MWLDIKMKKIAFFHTKMSSLKDYSVDGVIPSAPLDNVFPTNTSYGIPIATVVGCETTYDRKPVIPYETTSDIYNLLRQNHKFPDKLAQCFVEEKSKISKYYYICDTSGSMAEIDGKFYNGKKCSRIEEMNEFVNFVWNLFYVSKTPAKFISFHGSADTSDESNLAINRVLVQPNGGTPLLRTLSLVQNELANINGRKKLVIITDGESSDGDITNIIKTIQNNNVSITVRLCTDNDRIVNYWNRIDSDLEINLDIIDSFHDERKEVNKFNPRINYTLELHKFRELGVLRNEFDHIDERMLSPTDETFIKSLVGANPIYPQVNTRVNEDTTGYYSDKNKKLKKMNDIKKEKNNCIIC